MLKITTRARVSSTALWAVSHRRSGPLGEMKFFKILIFLIYFKFIDFLYKIWHANIRADIGS